MPCPGDGPGPRALQDQQQQGLRTDAHFASQGLGQVPILLLQELQGRQAVWRPANQPGHADLRLLLRDIVCALIVRIFSPLCTSHVALIVI
jgi:hypothetical protein